MSAQPQRRAYGLLLDLNQRVCVLGAQQHALSSQNEAPRRQWRPLPDRRLQAGPRSLARRLRSLPPVDIRDDHAQPYYLASGAASGAHQPDLLGGDLTHPLAHDLQHPVVIEVFFEPLASALGHRL
jgi:hypothetical protein